jgi:predicted Zn-dependent protease
MWLSLALCLPGQSGPPEGFQFTSIDDKLLEEVTAIERQFESKGLLFRDSALEAHLEEVARPLIDRTGTPERVQWKFHILRDPSVNAFALPNGSIYLHTGILALVQNDAQLAGVLAHEMTHVTNRHSFEQYHSYRKKMVAVQLLSIAGTWTPGAAWGTAIRVASQASGFALVLSVIGYSRALEREADVAAVDRISAAGYDASEVAKTFERFDEKLEVEPVTFFYRDHPKLQDRKKYTAELAAGKPRSTRSPSEADYLAIAQKAIQYNIQLDVDSRRFRTAVARGQRLVAFHPEDPQNDFLLAEAWRALGARTPQPDPAERSGSGKSDARRRSFKATAEEEEQELLSRPDGPAVREANFKKAEEFYRKAQALDASFAAPWRGLGLLYEAQGKPSESLAAYRQYLQLVPNGNDKLRIQRRIENLTEKAKP